MPYFAKWKMKTQECQPGRCCQSSSLCATWAAIHLCSYFRTACVGRHLGGLALQLGSAVNSFLPGLDPVAATEMDRSLTTFHNVAENSICEFQLQALFTRVFSIRKSKTWLTWFDRYSFPYKWRELWTLETVYPFFSNDGSGEWSSNDCGLNVPRLSSGSRRMWEDSANANLYSIHALHQPFLVHAAWLIWTWVDASKSSK